MSSLTCKQFIEFLDDYFAATQPRAVRDAFEAHLRECRQCREYLRTYGDTVALARSLAAPTPAVGASVPADAPPHLPSHVPDELVKAIMSAVGASTDGRAPA